MNSVVQMLASSVTIVNVVAVLLTIADWTKIFPGAMRIRGHRAAAAATVLALSLSVLWIEHAFAQTVGIGKPDSRVYQALLLGMWSLEFFASLALGAIGAGRGLAAVLLLRVMDREALAIWIVILSSKVLPLLLLIADEFSKR